MNATNQDLATPADYSGSPANLAFYTRATGETFTNFHNTVDDCDETVKPAFRTPRSDADDETSSRETVNITDGDGSIAIRAVFRVRGE